MKPSLPKFRCPFARILQTVKMPMCVVILVLKYEQGEVWAESQSSCVVVDSRWQVASTQRRIEDLLHLHVGFHAIPAYDLSKGYVFGPLSSSSGQGQVCLIRFAGKKGRNQSPASPLSRVCLLLGTPSTTLLSGNHLLTPPSDIKLNLLPICRQTPPRTIDWIVVASYIRSLGKFWKLSNHNRK